MVKDLKDRPGGDRVVTSDVRWVQLHASKAGHELTHHLLG